MAKLSKLERLVYRMFRGMERQRWERSLMSSGQVCAYRGDGGKRCAVGHIIPDRKYSSQMEQNSIGMLETSPPSEFLRSFYGLDSQQIYVLSKFQQAHDSGKYRIGSLQRQFVSIVCSCDSFSDDFKSLIRSKYGNT